MEIRQSRQSLSVFMLAGCGIWLIGLGLYFIFLRPPLLPEDLRYMRTSQGALQSAIPELERWVRHVFTVMGGFMTGAGVLTIFVTVNAYALRQKWAGIVLALAGFFTVGTMSLTNFQLDSDFKWLLLIPCFFWVIGLALHVIGRSDG